MAGMRFLVRTFWLAFAGLLALTSPVQAKLFTRITAEGGVLEYDLKANEGNGWYTESGNEYRFKVGFKQGERASADPVSVATLRVTDAEHVQGTHALLFQIDAGYRTSSARIAARRSILRVISITAGWCLPRDSQSSWRF